MSSNTDVNKVALPAGEFEKIFREAGVLTDTLSNAKSAQSKATQMGRFLAANVGREVSVNVKGRTGKAKLCMTSGRANKKLYYFEVRLDEPAAAAGSTPAATAGNAEIDDGLGSPAGNIMAVASGSASTGGVANDQQVSGEITGNAEEW